MRISAWPENIARWAVDHLEELRESDPDVPEELNDRAQDNWRPLLAIADLACGDWPRAGHRAARLLSGSRDDDDGAGTLLLADLRDLFTDKKASRLSSTAIVEELVKMEDRPWPEWKRGKQITFRQLAVLLKPFGIHSRSLRIDESQTAKGYYFEDFKDAFARYLSPLQSDTP